jgi:hypothetical protein
MTWQPLRVPRLPGHSLQLANANPKHACGRIGLSELGGLLAVRHEHGAGPVGRDPMLFKEAGEFGTLFGRRRSGHRPSYRALGAEQIQLRRIQLYRSQPIGEPA